MGKEVGDIKKLFLFLAVTMLFTTGSAACLVLNPDILNPDILNPDLINPDILN